MHIFQLTYRFRTISNASVLLLLGVLHATPSLAASEDQSSRVTCEQLIVGGEKVETVPFVNDLVRLFDSLEDIDKYVRQEDYPHNVNPHAIAQLNRIKQFFKGGKSHPLDPASKAFREILSTEVFDRRWQESDGLIVKRERELHAEMLLFARVIAEKNDVMLVVLPPKEVLWNTADQIEMRFYYVMEMKPTATDQIGPLNSAVQKSVFGNSDSRRNSQSVIPAAEGPGGFIVEEALTLFRKDATKHPALARLLKVFN